MCTLPVVHTEELAPLSHIHSSIPIPTDYASFLWWTHIQSNIHIPTDYLPTCEIHRKIAPCIVTHSQEHSHPNRQCRLPVVYTKKQAPLSHVHTQDSHPNILCTLPVVYTEETSSTVTHVHTQEHSHSNRLCTLPMVYTEETSSTYTHTQERSHPNRLSTLLVVYTEESFSTVTHTQ